MPERVLKTASFLHLNNINRYINLKIMIIIIIIFWLVLKEPPPNLFPLVVSSFDFLKSLFPFRIVFGIHIHNPFSFFAIGIAVRLLGHRITWARFLINPTSGSHTRTISEEYSNQMPEDDLIDIKFRLYDGSDVGPFRYSSASTVDVLKQRIVSDWPKGWDLTLHYSPL